MLSFLTSLYNFLTTHLLASHFTVPPKEYPAYTPISRINISENDRECFLDLRPYCNTAPHTVQETTSVTRAYETYRTLGLRILLVVNRYNQCVGTITRNDLTVENLAKHLITKGKNV
jgi:chloride channel 7